MLRIDLKAAGIPYETADGIFDFHALRAMYVTDLVATGADPKTVQKLARHSTITLTMELYAKLDKGAVAKAVNRLPKRA
jgi:integrase/recombinase XerD